MTARRRDRHRLLCTAALALGAAAAVAPAATLAAGPDIRTIPVHDVFVDSDLNAACGLETSLTVLDGEVTVRTFERDAGLQRVNTVNIRGAITAPGGTFALRNIGADVYRVAPDGMLLVTFTGIGTFNFAGSFTLNLTTGEVIREPRRILFDSDLAAACDALSG